MNDKLKFIKKRMKCGRLKKKISIKKFYEFNCCIRDITLKIFSVHTMQMTVRGMYNNNDNNNNENR